MQKQTKLTFLITGGPTREKLDPVRFLSNYSTGEMALALADAARTRGHRVNLILGPCEIRNKKGLRAVHVESARDMKRETERRFAGCDCLIMAAAVCDFRPHRIASDKIKKTGKGMLTLTLKENPDILKHLARRKEGRTIVGFALESRKLSLRVRRKRQQKKCDILVGNRLGTDGTPFGGGPHSYMVFTEKNNPLYFKRIQKRNFAARLIALIEEYRKDAYKKLLSTK